MWNSKWQANVSSLFRLSKYFYLIVFPVYPNCFRLFIILWNTQFGRFHITTWSCYVWQDSHSPSWRLTLEKTLRKLNLVNFSNVFQNTSTFSYWRALLSVKVNGLPYSVILTHSARNSRKLRFSFTRYTRALRKLTILQCDLEPIPYETDIFENKESMMPDAENELEPLMSLNYLKIHFKISEADINFLRIVLPRLIIMSAFVNRDFVDFYYLISIVFMCICILCTDKAIYIFL